jgi:SSS family solute:Na+ symporter
VVLTYVFIGGMRGTAWANAFQTVIFMVLGLVAFLVIANKLGDGEGIWSGLVKATAHVQEDHPEKLVMGPPVFTSLFFMSYLLIPLSAAMFPHIFQHWLTARSASTFKLPIIVHPIFITIVWLPCVLVGTWATSAMVNGEPLIPPDLDNVNAVLPMMVAKLSGPVLSGLLAAGILAAVMSSLDSQFLCLGTMFTNDIVLEIQGRDRYSDRQVVALARGFIVGIVVVTYLISLLKPAGIFDLAIWCFSGFTGLVPLVVASLYWKRITLAGATASVLVTVTSWIYFFSQAGYPPDLKYKFLGMLPVAAIFVLSTLALVVVSLLTRPPSDQTLARFFTDGKDRRAAS